MIALTGIYRYPLKSGAVSPLATTRVTLEGLVDDRCMMVVDADGICLTSRKAPGLLTIRAIRDGDDIVLQVPGQTSLVLDVRTLQPMPRVVDIWGDKILTLDGGAEAAEWLSKYLGREARLAVKGSLTERPLHLAPGRTVSLADTAPLLLAGTASLASFNEYLDHPVEMARFRPNLVIEGAEAFAEDRWRRVRIGEVEFIVAGACDRCVVTTLDPLTGIARSDREPLTTLARYRRSEDGNVYFGQFLIPVRPGRLHLGARVEVLEAGAAKAFLPPNLPKKIVQSSRVSKDAPPPGQLALRCIGIIDETHDARTFRFQPASGGIWSYRAGQFMTLSLNTAAGELRRSYTISSSPTRPETLEITVKRVPDGRGSNWLHDNLAVGSEIGVNGPSGRFCLTAEPGAKLLMLAAGSGITPMLSMLRAISDQGLDIAAHLHVSAKTKADLIADRELRLLAERSHGRITLSHNLTREVDDTGAAPGRLDRAMLDRHCVDWRMRQIYCCGPEEYRQHVRGLMEGEISKAQYHEESFGAHGGSSAPQSYAVVFQRSGKRVTATDSRTLLQIARDAGIELASNCEAGVCGTCRCQIISGDLASPDSDDSPSILDEDERQAGIILSCSVRPKGEVVIDL